MTSYSVQPRDWIFVKGYELLATDALKTTSERVIQKLAETAGDLIGNTIADKITKVSRTSSKNSSEVVTNAAENIGFDKEIPKEIYMHISRRKAKHYWWFNTISKNNKFTIQYTNSTI